MAEKVITKNDNGCLPMTVEYQVANGELINLDASTVRKYLVNGVATKVTDQEIIMYMNLCKFQRLNPFLKECYLIKYSDDPATLVVGKEAFLKRAEANKEYKGQKSGIYVLNANGELVERVGSLILPNERLVGGWAKVFRDGYVIPIETTVTLDEYVGVKANGQPNQNWSKRSGTMIRKVALCQALREAFPQSLGGMYSEDETTEINTRQTSTQPIVDTNIIYDISTDDVENTPENETPPENEVSGVNVEPIVVAEPKEEAAVDVAPANNESNDEILYVYYKEYKDNPDKYEKAGNYDSIAKRMPVRLKKISG